MAFPRVVLALALGLAWVAYAAPPARAGLVLGIAGGAAIPGSSANSFDVSLTNTGTSPADDVSTPIFAVA